jgi:predicted RNA polymerase sigma factor
MAVQSLKELAKNNTQDFPQSAPSEDDKLLQKALLSEIREKCHHFMTFDLTQEQRVTLLLRDLFSFSYEEIAAILDISADTVRSRLYRARQSLKRRFEKRCSWLNPDNPCRCENRIPYVLKNYPELLSILKTRLNREDYNQDIKEMMEKTRVSEEEIFASFPMLEIKLAPLLEKTR